MDRDKLYNDLTNNVEAFKLVRRSLSQPDQTVENEITKIYTQARTHRDTLIGFYVKYSCWFTVFVFTLISLQAYTRVVLNNKDFELIPQWALNLLVIGMFGEFVGLLTIVTKRVWDFQSFFNHHNNHKINSETSKQEGKLKADF